MGLKKYASCLDGYWCKEGNSVGNPTFGTGEKCKIGNYCDAGAGFPRQCDPGMACDLVGMKKADMKPCTIGYYCLGGTITPTPINISSDKGAICPAGYYCPVSTSSPIPCPQGKYNAFTQKGALTDCLVCPPTKYCEGAAVKDPLSCQDGFFCDGSDTSPRPENKQCPKGFSCVAGLKVKCPPGQY